MINFILGLLSCFIVIVIFTFLRKFILKRATKTIKKNLPKNLNCSICKTYPKDKEPFDLKKFLKAFKLNSLTEWVKDFVSLFNLRKLIIYGLILSTIYGYAYYKGRGNAPIKINLDYEKEFKMKLDGHYLIKEKYSQDLYIKDKNGQIIKQIRAKDFPLLAKELKPIGFILEPIGVAGYGAGENSHGFEAGAGVSFIKYWKWRIESFLTQKGIYLGTSYQITDNSGLGLGAGKGFRGDNRILLYYKWKF